MIRIVTRPGCVRPGQATVEFALLVPLVVMCMMAIIVATMAGLRVLSLADLARNAARAATVADAPCDAAEALVDSRATMRCTIDRLPSGSAQMVHIHLTDRWDVPDIVAAWIGVLAPRASATMLIEPPPVLG